MEFLWSLLDWNTWQNLMYALGLYKKNVKILIIGLDNAGKTTLLRRMVDGTLHQATPTQFPCSDHFTFGKCNISAFDLGGHERARQLWRDYYPAADGIVFVVDAADRDRLEEARGELTEVLNAEEMKHLPVLILGNKIDTVSALNESGLKLALGIPMTSGKGKPQPGYERAIEVFMCSVVRQAGYYDGFRWLNQYL